MHLAPLQGRRPVTRAGGAGCGARGRRVRPLRTRAARASILPAQRPAREVLAGLGRSFVVPARVTPAKTRKVSAPRLERPYRIERSGASRKAWPDAEPWGPAVSLARAAVERRQASAPRRVRAAPAGAASDDASVGVLLPCCFFLPSVRSCTVAIVSHSDDPRRKALTKVEMRCRSWACVLEMACSNLGAQKKAQRENGDAYLSPRAGRGRSAGA